MLVPGPTRLIGDVHGRMGAYHRAVGTSRQSIQLGDFGWGFISRDLSFLDGLGQHYHFRGNHDDPALARVDPRCIADGTFFPDLDLMVIGGAWSIDRAVRTPGVNWWADEELSIQSLERIAGICAAAQPKTVLTHDCPEVIARSLFTDLADPPRPHYHTRTAQALQVMFEMHQPDRWFFGHWHKSAALTADGCSFRCLDINEQVDIDL